MNREEKLKKARFYYKASKFYSIGMPTAGVKQSKNWSRKYENMVAKIEPPITQTELNLIPTNKPF